MSASSKKKLRNEQQTAKMTEKQVAEQKEAKKLTLYTTIFVVVLAVMVVFAIAIGVTRSITNSGVHERNTVALTVGDHEISNAELNYFYMSAINNFNTNYGNYAAMMGLDTSKPLDGQVINNDTGLTWADDFLNTAKDNARSVYAMADAAEAAGFTLSEDELAEIDTSISNMKMYATLYGYSSTKDFLKAQYGSGATEESYKQYVTVNALANAYYNSYSSSLTYTDADLRAAESENYDKYSSFTYNTYYLAASKFQAEDEDDSDKAVKAAEEAANSLIGEDVATVADFDAAIAALDINKDTEASSTAYTDQQYASVSTTVRDWITDSARKEGDKTVIANTTTSTDDDGNETKTTLGYYAVFFTGYHAWAGCPGNPLSHTMNGRNNHVFLNGTLCSEFLINSYTAGYYGVPVALLTGDKALCDFAKALIPAITTVPVNEGRGGSVTSLHPDEAVERIEAAAKEAVAKAAQCAVPMPEHFHMEIDFVKHHVAYSKSFYPGATLKDDKFVCFDSDDWYEVLRFCHFVLSDG